MGESRARNLTLQGLPKVMAAMSANGDFGALSGYQPNGRLPVEEVDTMNRIARILTATAVALAVLAPALAEAHPHRVCHWDRHHHRVCRWVR